MIDRFVCSKFTDIKNSNIKSWWLNCKISTKNDMDLCLKFGFSDASDIKRYILDRYIFNKYIFDDAYCISLKVKTSMFLSSKY